MGCDIVDAEDACSTMVRGGGGGQASYEAIIGVRQAQGVADEGLAGGADQHGQTGVDEGVQACDECPTLGEGPCGVRAQGHAP